MLSLLGSNVGAELSPDGAELSPDGQALLNFLEDNAFALDPSSGFASWNASDGTPCEWLRVLCGPNSAVRRLDLSACCLSVPLGADTALNLTQLSFLGSLQELDLSSNPGLFSYSHDFQSLTGLTWLDLSGSFIVGGLDVTFPALPSLQYLNAEGSLWGRYLIRFFNELRELVAFSLANNGCEAVIPEEVRNLTQLKSLDLSGNYFHGSIPKLEGLTRLVQLSVARNNLSGDVPTAPSLQYVDAADNNFTNLPDSFFRNSALKQVNLARNQLVGKLPGNIGGPKFLEVLDLSWNGLQGQIPSGVENVTHLDLSHNNLSGPIPLDIRPLSGSEQDAWVDLSGNALNGSIPASLLYVAARAAYVNLSRNSLTGNIPSYAPPKGLTQFRLDLSDNQLDGPLPSSFSSLLPQQLWLQNNNLSGDFIDYLTLLTPSNTWYPN